jgi:hypothetical protein
VGYFIFLLPRPAFGNREARSAGCGDLSERISFMSRVFKKSIVRYLDAAGKQVPKGTLGSRTVKQKSAKWYGRVPGQSKPVPFCAIQKRRSDHAE